MATYCHREDAKQWHLLSGSFHISFEILMPVISVCKILVWGLENIVISEFPRGDLGGKLNSITSREDWAT